MSLFEILIITVVLLCCLYVSYTDAKFRKIGNPYTYGLVAFGLACQGVFIYLGITTLPQVLWLLLGGLAVAFLMYYLGIWSPGDSKLFWAVSVALPPTLYSLGRWRYPPFVVAVNTFVPYFLSALQAILSEVEQKAHLLIVLAQMSRAEATELLRRVESVDAMVLGGGTGQTSATLEVNGTLLVQCVHWGMAVGELQITGNTDGQVIDYQWSRGILDERFVDDPQIVELMSRHSE